MSLLTGQPAEMQPDESFPDQPSTRERRRLGVGRHFERVLWAMLAIAVATFGVQHLSASNEPSPPATRAKPASTLAQSATELELRVQQDPTNAVLWQQLTQIDIQRAAQTLDPSFYQRATTALERARALAPDDPGTLTADAALSAALHRFADAEALAQRAIELDPYNSAALAVLVDAQVELGRYDDAARSLQLFANRKPGAPVLSRVSYLRELRGDFPGARTAMVEARQAVAGAGSFQRATLAAYEGDLLLANGDHIGARRAFDDSLELEPAHPIATVGRAKLLAASGKVDEAISLLTSFVDRTPVPGAATLLGELQEMSGRTADAERSFELVRALAQLQAAAGVDVDLDLALFEADHSPPSAEQVERARRAASDRPTVYGADALAWTLFRAGDVPGARAQLDNSLRLGGLDPLLHYHAAAIFEASGDRAAAVDHLRQVIDRNPWFSAWLQPEANALAGRLGLTWPTAGVGS